MALQSSSQQSENSKKRKRGKDAATGDLGDSENGLANCSSGNSIDAREFFKDMRRKAQESLLEVPRPGTGIGSDERDMDYMVQIVHALIKINQEIWERCKDRMAPPYPADFTIEKAERRHVRMVRLSYDNARADASAETVAITVKKSLHYKDFGPLPSIPSSLTELVLLRPSQERNDGQILHDYLEYIGRAALLEDGILVSFLQKLQTHLEEIQFFIGEIEKWLTELDPIVDFLNDLFDKELYLGPISNEWGQPSSDKTPIGSMCFNCYHPLSAHRFTSKIGMNLEAFCYSAHCSNLHPNSPSRISKFYIPPAPDILFKTRTSPGSMGLIFGLCTEDGRSKLKGFRTFMEMFKTHEKDKAKEEVSDSSDDSDYSDDGSSYVDGDGDGSSSGDGDGSSSGDGDGSSSGDDSSSSGDSSGDGDSSSDSSSDSASSSDSSSDSA